MIQIHIPGLGTLNLEHLVLDYNGTLAVDGELLPGVADRIRQLARQAIIHVVTADTFGSAQSRLEGLPCELTVIAPEGQLEAKRAYVERLGARECVCIGNGRNDQGMIEAAALGIAVVQQEGASSQTVICADVVVGSIRDALDLLVNPRRLVATLRG